jgi:hypothetical protein
VADVVVTPAQLGTFLQTPSISVDRAQMMLDDTMVLVRPYFAPNDVPAEAAGVIRFVAGRGYTTSPSPRQTQLDASGSPFAGGRGGVYLDRVDRETLTDIATAVYGPGGGSGAGGAFSIDMLPAGYLLPVVPVLGADWDQII